MKLKFKIKSDILLVMFYFIGKKNYSKRKIERAKNFDSLIFTQGSLSFALKNYSSICEEKKKSSKRTWACACRQCLTFATERCAAGNSRTRRNENLKKKEKKNKDWMN